MFNRLFIVKKRPPPALILLWGLFITISIGWIFSAARLAYADVILDIVFFISSALALLSFGFVSWFHLSTALLLIGYVIVGMALAVVARDATLLDFLMAYKFFWYLVLLIPFSQKELFDAQVLHRLLRLTLILFLLVYAAKYALGSVRPMFFRENNFELLLVCLLFYAAHISDGKSENLDFILLFAIIGLSGSRSAAALAATVALFSFDLKKANSLRAMLALLMALAGVAVFIFVMQSRSTGGIETTDRYSFFLHFLHATNHWSFWDYLLGSPRITPLPNYVCESLSFYNKFMSFKGDDTCYSVILHSFNLRIIYDHGLLVTAWAILIIIMVIKNRSFKEKVCTLALLGLNGMSISSMNSVYAAIGISLIAAVIPSHKDTSKSVTSNH